MARLLNSIPYTIALMDATETETSLPGDDAFFCYATDWSHQPLKEDTTSAWNFLNRLFPDDQTVAVIDGRTFSRPVRLECFWNDYSHKRGITVFDQHGRLIVHVVPALLGYEGSGPALSWQLMERLGVTRELFDQLQTEVHNNRPYMLIVSREQRIEHDDDQRLIPNATPVLDEWTWGRVK